jgi:type IV pilus assembly protein PilC
MVFVVPIFTEMFAGLGSALPAPTQLVIHTSAWIVGNILYIFIGIIVLIACLKNQKIRYKMASMIPGLRGVLKKSSIIQYARHLSIMLSLGAPLREAFSSAAESLNNPIHSERLKNVGRTLPDTKRLQEEMGVTEIFPNIILKMIRAGEKSESLGLVFEEISKFYEKDFSRSLHRMVSSLEILAVIFVGIFVGGIVISMYLPIFKMAGTVG